MNLQKKHLYLILSLIIVLVLSACGAEQSPLSPAVEPISLDYVIAEGHLVPLRSSWLNFNTQGRVAEIMVDEGEKVTQDQILMRLGNSEGAEAAILTAELELARARQELDDFTRTSDLALAQAWQAYQDAQTLRGEAEQDWEDLDLDTLEDRVDDARIEVRDRQSDLDDALEEWDKYQDVDQENYARKAAKDDLEKAQEDYNQAQRDLEEAIRKIDLTRADLDAALAAEKESKRDYEMWLDEGFDLDQKKLLDARISAAEASLSAAHTALENYTLKAPYAGTVTDIYPELGQFAGPESMAALLADISHFKIETSDLTELEVVKISQGQTVEIIPDALPDLLIIGKVDQISQSFTTQAGDIIYTVTISLDEGNPALRWGMTVELKFLPE
jgi:HlyD family secretion protein